MSTPATLAPAVPADAPAIATVHAACFEEDPWEEDSLRRMLAETNTLCFVCRRGGGICGFALCRVAADECEVLSCGVAPVARGLGVARRLLAAAFAEAARRGARRALLEVDEGNASARALYASLGLRPVGRRRGYYARRGQRATDALILAADL